MSSSLRPSRAVPQEHHILWKRAANLGVNVFAVMEREHIMEVVKQALVYDQLDIANIAAFELMPMRAQTVEYTHLERL